MNYRKPSEDIPLGELINYTQIWIAAVENEMESLLSAKSNLL